MKRLVSFLSTAAALALIAGQAAALDLSASGSAAGSASATLGVASTDASTGVSAGASFSAGGDIANSIGGTVDGSIGGSASISVGGSTGGGGSVGGSVGGTLDGFVGGTIGGDAGSAGIAASGNANVSGPATGAAQIQNLQVFTSNAVNVGTALNMTSSPNGTFITVEPAATFMTGLSAFHVAASAATTANGRITLNMTDGALRTAIMSSLAAAGSATATVTIQ